MIKYCKYLGLSLSFCIKDILEKKVNIDDVECIVSATAFNSMEEAFKMYIDSYWSDYDNREVFITLSEIWPRVFQPRTAGTDEYCHTIANGCWLNYSEGKIVRL